MRRGLNRGLLDALAPNWRSTGGGAALRRALAAEDWAGLEALFRRLLAGIPHDWHRRNDIARYEGYWSSVFYAWFQASMDGVAVEDATSRGRLDMAVVTDGAAYVFEFKVAARAAPASRPAGADRGDAAESADRGAAAESGDRGAAAESADRGAAAESADRGAAAESGTALPPDGARPSAGRGDAAADRPALAQLKARRYADKYRAPNRRVHLIGVEIGAETRDLTAFDVEPG